MSGTGDQDADREEAAEDDVRDGGREAEVAACAGRATCW